MPTDVMRVAMGIDLYVECRVQPATARCAIRAQHTSDRTGCTFDQKGGNESRLAHSSAAVERLDKAITTRTGTSQDEKTSAGSEEAPAASVLLEPVLEDSRVVHSNNTTNLTAGPNSCHPQKPYHCSQIQGDKLQEWARLVDEQKAHHEQP
jgi:hypothetical protein